MRSLLSVRLWPPLKMPSQLSPRSRTPGQQWAGRSPGATAGPGSTEAARRDLSASDVRTILQAEIDERLCEADRYEQHGRSNTSYRLRREAAVLMKYV